jgi:hypothetical protein
MNTYQGPAADIRDAMQARSMLIAQDFEQAWARFLTNHRNARIYTSAHELITKDLSSPDALTYWRNCWYRVERRIWTKHEQAAYRSLETPVACPNPACRHNDCRRTDVYCPMCGAPHSENITRGGAS